MLRLISELKFLPRGTKCLYAALHVLSEILIDLNFKQSVIVTQQRILAHIFDDLLLNNIRERSACKFRLPFVEEIYFIVESTFVVK